MSITAKPPFKYFTDTAGEALEAGKIYVGVAGLDAEANPITAYWNSAATITAVQPIRTIGGVPDNAGTPSDFFTKTDYSITVRDKNDVLVYSKLQQNASDLPGLFGEVYEYDTVALMVADGNLSVGDRTRTLGYTAIGDGGGNDYAIVAAATGTDDGGAFIDLTTHQAQGLFPSVERYVKQWGAVGDDVTDDLVALQAAADASFISGVGYALVEYPAGIYAISGPLRLTGNHRMDGTNAIIKATAGYAGVTLDNIGLGGTTLVDALLIFLLGDFNDIGGAQRENAFIGNGLTLDCNEVSGSGIYLERMPYADVNCKVINTIAGGNAIDIGPYCWGTHLDGPTVENFSENGIAIGEGSNGITITSPRIWGKNKTGLTGILVKPSANVNGLAITGGFVEKIDYGLYVDRGNGPVNISGTDFEVCTINCIGIYGNVADAFKATVTATGCYFSATGSKIYATYGIININGCRLRSLDDFETGTGGFIDAASNQYESGVPTIVAGSNVAVDIELPWTPVLWDDSLSDAESQTYAHNVGTYNRVGDKIFFQGNISLSSLGTLGVGEGARIGGLPRASRNVANSHSTASVGLGSGLNIAAVNALAGYVGVGADYISLQKFSATTGTANLTIAEVTAAGWLIFSGWYTV